MRSVELEHIGTRLTLRETYDRIRDFAHYPQIIDVVRSVTAHQAEPGEPVISDWEVDFRNGILCWSEEDVFDDEALTIVFRQTEGDFESFEGRWEVEPAAAGGAHVRFAATFDFGLPSLAGIIDPVAERVLRETIGHILRALLEEQPAAAEREAA
ncbi:type II toxin-antitoxin system RatA family toxin [Streptomyces sp. NPDC020792]|uniref:type II toxin-antitoxin system RatA family toxin n=1 Tax=Streptomyces sp. NPDC020792 TaxID=3365089 RepID=UPI0037A4CBE3